MNKTKNHIEQWMENEKKKWTDEEYALSVREKGILDVFSEKQLSHSCCWDQKMFSLLKSHFEDCNFLETYTVFYHASKRMLYFIDFSLNDKFYRFCISEDNSTLHPNVFYKKTMDGSYGNLFDYFDDELLVNVWTKLRHTLTYLTKLPKFRLKITIGHIENPLLRNHNTFFEDKLITRKIITKKKTIK